MADRVPVKVAVRVRPLSTREQVQARSKCVRVIPDTNQLVLGADRAFTFDYVFPVYAPQDAIFESCVQPLVDGCFEGYNATVFAYGQTGTGKTYTMCGPGITGEHRGVMPRAIEYFFEQMESRSSSYEYTVRVSYVEIYMEKLTDLLSAEAPVSTTNTAAGGTSNGGPRIREDGEGHTIVMGAETPLVSSAQEVLQLLTAGTLARHTSATLMNEHSSRSHSIFTLTVEQRSLDDSTGGDSPSGNVSLQGHARSGITSSMFHFCDLAGSERAKQTGNVGGRFKESVHINSGLLALGNVVNALSEKKGGKRAGHVPYRDSKLTRMLKDSLGGNARTLMLTCISPSDDAFEESLNTLKYAARARFIQNKPIVNTDSHEAAMQEMMAEIESLREQLRGQLDPDTSAKPAHKLEVYDRALRFFRQRNRQLRHAIRRIVQADPAAALQTLPAETLRQLAQPQHVSDVDGLRGCSDVVTSSSEEELDLGATAAEGPGQEGEEAPELPEDSIELSGSLLRKGGTVTLRSKRARPGLELPAIGEPSAPEGGPDTGPSAIATALAAAEEREKQDASVLQEKLDEINELRAKNLRLESALQAQSGPSLAGLPSPREARTAPAAPARGRSRDATAAAPDDRPPTEIGGGDKEDGGASKDPLAGDTILREVRSRGQIIASQLEEEYDEVQLGASSEGEGEGEGDSAHPANSADSSRPFPQESPTASSAVSRNGGSPVDDGKGADAADAADAAEDPEALNLRFQLEQAENRARAAESHMHELSFNIRMKQQLIQTLVASDREARLANEAYATDVARMTREVTSTKQELNQMRSNIKKTVGTVTEVKLRKEYEAKLAAGRARIATLAKKQKESEKLAKLQRTHASRLKGLENTVARMTKEQERLQERLHGEVRTKKDMERELTTLRRLTAQERRAKAQLESKAAQHESSLQRRGEELKTLQRKLRDASKTTRSENPGLVWQNDEIEAEVQRRLKLAQLQREEEERNRLAEERKEVSLVRDSLQIEKLRRSQSISTNMLRASQRLENVRSLITAKQQHLQAGQSQGSDPGALARLQKEIQELEADRTEYEAEITRLQEGLEGGLVLGPEKERRLVELTEHLSVIDATLQFRNESITNRQRASLAAVPEGELSQRLAALSREECQRIITGYFQRIVELRAAENEGIQLQQDLALRVNEQEAEISQVREALAHHELAADRRIIQLQQQHEEKVQFLLQQLQQGGDDGPTGAVGAASDETAELRREVESLQRDLYYYKKSTRDLRRKLRAYENADATSDGKPVAASNSFARSDRPSTGPRPPSSRHAQRDEGVTRQPPSTAPSAAVPAQEQAAAAPRAKTSEATILRHDVLAPSNDHQVAGNSSVVALSSSGVATPIMPSPSPLSVEGDIMRDNRGSTATYEAGAASVAGEEPIGELGQFEGNVEEDSVVNFGYSSEGSPVGSPSASMQYPGSVAQDSIDVAVSGRNPWA